MMRHKIERRKYITSLNSWIAKEHDIVSTICNNWMNKLEVEVCRNLLLFTLNRNFSSYFICHIFILYLY